MEAAIHLQALIGFDDPGGHLQLLPLVGTGQVVDLVPHHGHGPIQAAILGQIQPEKLRMPPGAALQPTDVNRVVGMAQAVDVLGTNLQVDDERVGTIPDHGCASRLAARARASAASWVI